MHTRPAASRSSHRGMALIVSLLLLLVMTMVAVVAMRSTTLDIKMTTNTTQSRRAFENSDGSRDAISPLLEAHVFYHGWPTSVGGTVADSANFVIPSGMRLANPSLRFDLGQNGVYSRFNTTANPDATYDDDVNGNGVMDPEDFNARMWVTRIGIQPAAGSNLGSNAADQGVGGGAANKYVIFDLRSDGSAVGNARSRTGADYRALVR